MGVASVDAQLTAEPQSDPAAVPTVDVVMPVRDEARYIDASLGAVLRQTHPGIRSVVVSVGPSTDGTDDIVRRYASTDARVCVVENPEGLASTGLNAALEQCTSDYVVRVDGHIVVPEDYVARLLATALETGSACVGPCSRNVGHTPVQRGIALAMSSPFGIGNSRYRTGGEPGPVDTVPYGLYERRTLDAIGWFRPELVRNQDDELNDRLRRAGGTVYLDPAVVVDYHPRRSLRALASQYRQYGYWRWHTRSDFGQRLRPRQLAPVALVPAAVTTGLLLPITPVPLMGFGLAYLGVLGALGATAPVGSGAPVERVLASGAGATMHWSYGLGFWGAAVGALGRRLVPSRRS